MSSEIIRITGNPGLRIPDLEIERYPRHMPSDTGQCVFTMSPAEALHAFRTSGDYRESIEGIECTASFLIDGKYLVTRFPGVPRPTDVTRYNYVELKPPQPGWITEYNNEKGFPTKTGSREEASAVFREHASRFSFSPHGVRLVTTGKGHDIDHGFFNLDASSSPEMTEGILCRRIVGPESLLRQLEAEAAEAITRVEGSIGIEYRDRDFEGMRRKRRY